MRPELRRAADIAVRDILAVREGERVLIVTNPYADGAAISAALFSAAEAVRARPVAVIQPVKGHLEYAEEAVIKAIESGPDVFIAIMKERLGKDPLGLGNPYEVGGRSYDHVFNLLLSEGRMRAFWSPSITEDIFSRTVPIDYGALRRRCAELKMMLDGADWLHVTTPAGTDLRVAVSGRETDVDDGDLGRAGLGGNLPAGEVFVSPVVGESNGVAVIDGSITCDGGDVLLSEPVRLKVERGFITDITGGVAAGRLRATIERARARAAELAKEGKITGDVAEEYARNAGNLGEFGIGLNPAARITGNMVEDEKAFRTCHIAVGSNYEDDAQTLIHLDAVMREPTIVAERPDGLVTVMDRGTLLTGRL